MELVKCFINMPDESVITFNIVNDLSWGDLIYSVIGPIQVRFVRFKLTKGVVFNMPLTTYFLNSSGICTWARQTWNPQWIYRNVEWVKPSIKSSDPFALKWFDDFPSLLWLGLLKPLLILLFTLASRL